MQTSVHQWAYSFSSLQEVAASPADVAARVVAVEEGKNVAATFSRTSEVLSQLKTGAKSHAQQANRYCKYPYQGNFKCEL